MKKQTSWYYKEIVQEKGLGKLTKRAIKRLQQLAPPIVRVCGPLTSGGFGYASNLARFMEAERILKEQGYTVFDYFDNEDEQYIKDAGLDWSTVMEQYHRPILETGLIKIAFFLPDWESSNGATWEREVAMQLNIEIREFPEGWFKNFGRKH